MPKRNNYTYIRLKMAQENYKLLSDSYKNNKTKLKTLCSRNHIYFITWNDWVNGYRCGECHRENMIGPLSFNWPDYYDNLKEYIYSEFESEGYELTSKVNLDTLGKLEYICPKKHRHFINWKLWLKGHRCPYCYGNAKLSIDDVKYELKRENYKLLSKRYINNKSELICRCPKEHIWVFNMNSWQKGRRCRKCYGLIRSANISGPFNPNWKGGISGEPYCQGWTKEYKEFIKERDGYKCLNPYCSSKNPDDLTVHHVDYNKKSCELENLITICRSCNARANYDRNWHKSWYQVIIYRRYSRWMEKIL